MLYRALKILQAFSLWEEVFSPGMERTLEFYRQTFDSIGENRYSEIGSWYNLQ